MQDLNTGSLRLPDLRGMYAEAAGFDSLGAGGVHGDGGREDKWGFSVNDGVYFRCLWFGDILRFWSGAKHHID